MKRLFLIILSLFFLLLCLPGSTANAVGTGEIRSVEYSCPGKATIIYDLTTSQSTDVELYYSHNKIDWLRAQKVTGDIEAQKSGTGKTITWDGYAGNVRYGRFYFKIELPPQLECVWINSVCWATRNVGEFGTFVENPEDAEMFYQWNRKIAWPATSTTVTGWDSSTPTGITWEKINDPSPEGYRVPTIEEIQKLLDATKVTSAWITQNGVNGRKFTDIATGNSLFLPAAGYRDYGGGALSSAGSSGSYWSSTQRGSSHAYGLGFGSGLAGWYSYIRGFGFSVRAVAE